MTLFTSATILLLNMWNARKSGLAAESIKDIREIQKVVDLLQSFMSRLVSHCFPVFLVSLT